MTVNVRNILNVLEKKAPFGLAEAWDNVGLLIGDPGQEVTGVMAGLDPTTRLLDEALANGCNTIITHHPVIFKPISSINTANPEGRLLQKALTNGIAIIGCHTNFDSAEEGVSDVLASRLGLDSLRPLVIPDGAPEHTGLGRIGTYHEAIAADQFLSRLLKALVLEGVQMTRALPEQIRTVAVCGGSGSDFAEIAHRRGADVYVSAEIKHNIAIWANENNFCIVDGTHYATEKPAVALLVEQLQQTGKDEGWKIKIMQSSGEHHPFVYRTDPAD